MIRPKLKVEERKVLGKKVKKLRREGLIPANIFGKEIKTTALQVEGKEFSKLFKEVGETSLVDVNLGDKTLPALISNVQKDPLSGQPLHIDFHQVSLKEKVETKVPISLTGEAPAEKAGIGLILQTLQELEIACLPQDIPPKIEVEVTSLTEVGSSLHVKDIKLDKQKIEVKNNPEEVVVSVQTAEMKEEVEEVVTTPAEVEVIEEKKEEGKEVEAETEKTEEFPKQPSE